ncbi:MAG: SUMF1/EgtB/PvdO family nonheme iron enzyme [Phycisphaerales bacterium]
MTSRRRIAHALVFASLVLGLWAAPALAQPDPSGIDFVTIGATGNRGYDGPDPNGLATGRGAVGYEYKIGRYEVTAGQWGEFFTAVAAQSQPLPWVTQPSIWHGTSPGPSLQMMPVGGVTWRTAAMYCNWLHNGKTTDRAGFMNGAYDVSTFGANSEGVFTDQPAHSPGARYWIPTLDEWMKAAHYDPAKQNPDGSTGGWWLYLSSDTPLRYGLPPWLGGNGQANAGFALQDDTQFGIPLGAYADSLSPWGLLDTAGATRELSETVFQNLGGVRYRLVKGSAWATPVGSTDTAWGIGGVGMGVTDYAYGLRLAAAIPNPGTTAVIVGGVWLARQQRRRGKAGAR